jgi:hypothetical protein
MPQKRIEVSASSLVKLLTHYTDGAVPIDSELRSFSVSKMIERWLCLGVASKEWPQETLGQPLHVRYEGRKVMSWGNDKDAPMTWNEAQEGLRR